MSHNQTRRTFLKLTSASVVAATAFKSPAATAKSANDKLVVGLIGCGGRGVPVGEIFKSTPNVEVAYVCDVDQARLQAGAEHLGVDSSRAVHDMRQILDDQAVDAVIIATPDHWHSPAAILACDAGKHVYVEKPISHNIREGRLLVEAAKRKGVQVQHGTQSRSNNMLIEGIELLQQGKIGAVLAAKAWNVQRRGSIGHGKDSQPPAGLDYDTWIGPAAAIPYRQSRVHQWRWWHHFGTGDMGNDGTHDLDYARWGLGVDTHPARISALGGKFFFDDDQEFPDTQQVTFEYPGNAPGQRPRLLIYEQRLWSTNYPYNVDNGAEFYGTEGQLFLSRRGKIQWRDGKNKVVETGIQPEPSGNGAPHIQNFCDAIRNGAKLNADASIGHLSSSLVHLGNIATRFARTLTFDPLTERIIEDEEANALVRRTYRNHWGTPRDV